ncbi:MAG: glycosyltransferase family 2 protein [Candidatus Nanoarchaeia archaeon]|nr:glycosyltransferase family 2 protein [Candidatus Nanoarchaeia archaeon]
MKVVITIPAYNEEKTITPVIKDIKEVMGKTDYNYQILVVDDGSTDKTVEISKKAGADVVYSHKKNCGLAIAFKTEMKKCVDMQADIIVHTDADGQYPS